MVNRLDIKLATALSLIKGPTLRVHKIVSRLATQLLTGFFAYNISPIVSINFDGKASTKENAIARPVVLWRLYTFDSIDQSADLFKLNAIQDRFALPDIEANRDAFLILHTYHELGGHGLIGF